MSAWADLAGDDSNLSMAADEFGELSVLGDISNSVSHNRSRFDPELDNSKQGLNRQLKLFGLGNDSNSNLSKKRRHSDLQTEEDDVDMPPKSKQRTSGPGQNNFSRFLEPGVTSAPDLSSLSSSSTNASGTTGSLGSVSTPTSAENQKPRTWYSAILGKNKGRSSKKGTPQSVSSSHVPALTSTTNTTANPTPKSTSKTVKLGGSIPSSVRRRRMLRKRKSKSSPHKRVESTTSRQQEEVEDVVVVEATISPEKERQQYQPMDQDGGGDTREAFENGLKVLKTESQGRIYVPLDILESTEKQAEQPKPTPFRLMRSKSAGKCGSMSPTKLSFTEGNSPPPASGVSDSCASSPPVVPFNLFNFMPLPIPAASFGLTTSTSVSNSNTPNNEPNGQEEIASVVQPQPLPATLPFVPFVPPVLPMNGLGFPLANSDESKTNQPLSVPSNPMLFNFVTMPLPLSTQISSTSSTAPLATSPAFVPFLVAPPTLVQRVESIAPATETEAEPQTGVETNAMDTDETEVVDVEDGKEEAEPVSIPSSSVWAAAQLEEDDDDGVPSWAKKCFKQEVARNKVLRQREDHCKVEQRKLEMQYKIREKQLLPIEHARISGPYGSDNRDITSRQEYHPYAENAKHNSFKMDRRMRGRARTRSLSEGVESPLCRAKVHKKNDSTSPSGTSATSPSQGVSVEARDLPYQEPEPVTADKIAWRLHQIEMAKNTTGYKNYMAQIPKCQRKKKHPSTPNPKEKISKRRWLGKYKVWRQQLHEFDIEESMDIDERPEGQPETRVESCSIPTPANVELVPSAPQEEEQ